jgi:hypothetical protein
MSTEANEPTESYQEGTLDPFLEPRTMPGNWDLSGLPNPAKPNGRKLPPGKSEEQPESSPENSEAELSRRTLADWHLEPFFDPKPSPNSDLSAF